MAGLVALITRRSPPCPDEGAPGRPVLTPDEGKEIKEEATNAADAKVEKAKTQADKDKEAARKKWSVPK